MLEYLSKHTQKWTEFKSAPTRGELLSLKKYNYRISKDGKEAVIDDLIRQIDGKDIRVVTIS